MKKFKGRSFKYDLVFNDQIFVWEVVELSTGRVKANSSDRLHASALLYEFDGIYDSEPIQLSLFD